MNIKDRIQAAKERVARALVKKLLPGFHVQKNVPKGIKRTRKDAPGNTSLI